MAFRATLDRRRVVLERPASNAQRAWRQREWLELELVDTTTAELMVERIPPDRVRAAMGRSLVSR